MGVNTTVKVGDLVRWDSGGTYRSHGIVLKLAVACAQVRWEATSCGKWAASSVWEPLDTLHILSNTPTEIK